MHTQGDMQPDSQFRDPSQWNISTNQMQKPRERARINTNHLMVLLSGRKWHFAPCSFFPSPPAHRYSGVKNAQWRKQPESSQPSRLLTSAWNGSLSERKKERKKEREKGGRSGVGEGGRGENRRRQPISKTERCLGRNAWLEKRMQILPGGPIIIWLMSSASDRALFYVVRRLPKRCFLLTNGAALRGKNNNEKNK